MIYKPVGVSEQPSIEALNWAVIKVAEDDIIVSDQPNGDGRVSSYIVEWDSVERIATTKSGRQYILKPENRGIKMSSNAEYVLEIKIRNNPWVDISEKYLI